MLLKKPYFMENDEWYYHDDKKNRYYLTDKAPKKAQESYNEFYAELDKPDPVLFANILDMAEQRKRQHLKDAGKSSKEIEQIIQEWRYGK